MLSLTLILTLPNPTLFLTPNTSAVSMWYSYISIDIDRYFTKYLDIDIDTPAIVAGQSGAKTQCSVYQYRYLQ